MFDVHDIANDFNLHLVLEKVNWDCPPATPRHIACLYDQTFFIDGVIYLSSTADAAAFFKDNAPQAYAGSILILTDYHGQEIQFPPLLTVFGFAEPFGMVFNKLNEYVNLPYDNSISRQFGRYWNELCANPKMSTNEIMHMFSNLNGIDMPFAQMACVIFDRTEKRKIPYKLILDQILSIIPHSVGTVRNDELVIMITYAQRHYDYQFDTEKILNILEKYNAYMCIGHGTRDLSTLPVVYDLVLRLAKLSYQLHVSQESRIYTFERVGIYLVIDFAAKGFFSLTDSKALMYLAHPAIAQISRYDKEKNDNLRTTLYFYLLTDKNIAKTSERLFMHRNTVMNKIKKVCELCNLDLENPHLCERLLFSCQLVRYCEMMYPEIIHGGYKEAEENQ